MQKIKSISKGLFSLVVFLAKVALVILIPGLVAQFFGGGKVEFLAILLGGVFVVAVIYNIVKYSQRRSLKNFL